MIVESINNKFLDLWDEFHKKEPDATRLQPNIYREILDHSILFVGVNPSFRKNADKRHYRYKGTTGRVQFLEKEVERLGNTIKTSAVYHRSIDELVKECKVEWTDIDLFAIRETSQKKSSELLNLKFTDNDDLTMSKFAERQLVIAFEIFDACNPRIIVVINALASRIFMWYCNKR